MWSELKKTPSGYSPRVFYESEYVLAPKLAEDNQVKWFLLRDNCDGTMNFDVVADYSRISPASPESLLNLKSPPSDVEAWAAEAIEQDSAGRNR